ncbi:MAG: hypothetical protein JZU65_10530 [Chlorobium sp.]|nr:hypothetical protein [Chlorobium sp.]
MAKALVSSKAMSTSMQQIMNHILVDVPFTKLDDWFKLSRQGPCKGSLVFCIVGFFA